MEPIVITANINAPVTKVWEYYNNPEHMVRWNHAGDWVSPFAENDLRVGGRFKSRMEPPADRKAEEGDGFDFTGTYTEVTPNSVIRYVMDDKRSVSVEMVETDGQTKVTITFDPENVFPAEHQQAGWQDILNNFKSYVENN